MHHTIQKIKNNMPLMYFFICINIVFLFLFFSTPLYNHTIFISDSGIYANIAKEILNGRVLYKEAFDHKGPFIFFIHLIGQLFSNENIGVFLIDVFLFNIAFYFQYKTMQLNKNKTTTYLLLLIDFIFLFQTYGIIIPETIAFMTFSYISYWLLSKQYLSPTPLQLIVCGLLTGLLFWIKFSLCVFIAVIYIYFIIKNFSVKNIVYPLIGFMIPTIIVLSYFIYHNAVLDLIQSYFLINSGYKNSTFIPSANFWALVACLICFLAYYIKSHKIELVIITISYIGLIFLSFIMTGKNFPNYYLPFMGVISLFAFPKLKIKYLKQFKIALIIVLVIAFLFLLIIHTIQLHNSSHQFNDPIKLSQDIGIPNSIALLYYSETVMMGELEEINYKYFFTPSLLYEQYPEMWNQLYNDICYSKIEYLLTVYKDGEILHYSFYDGSEKTQEYIEKINAEILNNYEQYQVYHNYVLWKRKIG